MCQGTTEERILGEKEKSATDNAAEARFIFKEESREWTCCWKRLIFGKTRLGSELRKLDQNADFPKGSSLLYV